MWAMFIILNALDAYTTWTNIQLYGISVELNPIIYHVLDAYGPHALFGWKAVWVGIVLCCHKWITLRVLITLNIVFLAIVLGNAFVHKYPL